jgi:glucosamine-phosphate N-acetyltransferase
VGHIEDIAVAKSEQGKKLGIKIIGALDFIGKKIGCYKVLGSRHFISRVMC